jgi:hypothetical protein
MKRPDKESIKKMRKELFEGIAGKSSDTETSTNKILKKAHIS